MEVQHTITQLTNSYNLLVELTAKLQSFSGPKEHRQELADSIQARLKQYENGVQTLAFRIDDQQGLESEETLKRQRVTLDKLRENVKLAKQRFRTAQIESKQRSRLSWKAQRDLLFQGADPEKQSAATKNMSVEDRVVQKSQDITQTLQRVHRMAQTEVIKSELNIDELEQSTRNLTKLEEKYTAFDVLLSGSKRLIRHLEQADTWDRRYMLASLSFLATVMLWILWRRVLKLPVMFILWTLARVLGLARFVSKPVRRAAVRSRASNSADSLVETVAETILETVSQVTQSEESASLPLTTPSNTVVDEVVESVAQTVAQTVIETVAGAVETLLGSESTAGDFVHSDL
uniref:ARAD1D37598p n=1 Tax=Blastobotrys adeninivorans TaxID=409370 RepID=A0A060TBU6_BLAAD